MNGSTLRPKPGHLLARLSPQIFYHPVWRHFGGATSPDSGGLVTGFHQHLDQRLPGAEPDTACQLLLISAVLQRRIPDHGAAMNSLQQVWWLAKGNQLSRMVNCAAWGAGALCLDLDYHELAVIYLTRLRDNLGRTNDWMLANTVAVLAQALTEPGRLRVRDGPTSELALTLDWLIRWGEPPPHIEVVHNRLSSASLTYGQSDPSPKRSGTDRLTSLWHLARRVFKGELRLSLVERQGRPPNPGFDDDEPPPAYPPPAPKFPATPENAPVPDDRPLRASDDHPVTKSTGRRPGPYSAEVQPLELLPEDDTVPESSELGPAAAAMPIAADPAWLTIPIPEAADEPETPTRSPTSPVSSNIAPANISVSVYCLGAFRAYQNDTVIDKWPGHIAKSIFKYLVNHRDVPINREVLVDLFWREVDPEAARKNLHQAIYKLRQTLQKVHPEVKHIHLEDGCYFLNPELEVWLDSDTFSAYAASGQRLARENRIGEAILEYEAAASLYQGDFLAEDRYEDWPIVQRESLKHTYLDILDRLSRYYFDQRQLAVCVTFCQKILAKDNCREDAHRRLMRCYFGQNQPHLALRQYHQCVENLRDELDVPPMTATIELYQKIQKYRVQFSSH